MTVPAWRLVGAGSARCQTPPFAVSVPSWLRTQPPYVSRSSYSGPQFAFALPIRLYGQPAASMSMSTAALLRSVCGAMSSSAG